MERKKGKYSNINVPAVILVVGLVWAVTFSFNYEILARLFTYKIEKTVPEWLPIVVFSLDKITVIRYEEINQFLEENPNASFLVPEDKEQYFNEQLVDLRKKQHIDSFPKFTVQHLSKDNQFIKLGFYGDGDLVVCYQATNKSVFPSSYRLFGPGFVFLLLPFHIIVNSIIVGLLYFFWKIVRKRLHHC